MSSRSRWFASSTSSGRPVSFHHPLTTYALTFPPPLRRPSIASDLELVPPRRLQAINDREDRGTQQVDAHEREVALRLLGLLDEPGNVPRGIEFRDAEALRMRDGTQRDARVVVVRLKLLDHVTDAALEDVVAEVHAERVPS